MNRRTSLMTLHPDLIDRSYTMNEKLEYLTTRGGMELDDGMVVLVAPVVRRYNVLDMTTDDGPLIKMALTANRWCTVENLEVAQGRVGFTGVYKDGTTAKRVYPSNVAWLIKRYPDDWRESPNPKVPMSMEEKRNTVIDLVVGAMAEQNAIDCGDRVRMTPQQLRMDFALTTTDEIMRLFE